MTRNTLCLLPHLKGLGGPASFYARLTAGLDKRGIPYHHDPLAADTAAILVIGGPFRVLFPVWQARQRGVRVVQRLNGMNWVHRKRNTGLKHYLRSEWNNQVLSFVRRFLANRVIYQSRFTENWWHTVYGPVKAPGRVIYNGIDLQRYTPQGPEKPPEDRWRILLVEGRLGGGYEQGLLNAIHLGEALKPLVQKPVELVVVGEVPPALKADCLKTYGDWITWAGVVKREQIPALDRSAHLLFSADLNASCPNAVIEALACGLPVTAFATGSLPELLENDAGRCAPYGTNFWELEAPEIDELALAARAIIQDQAHFRASARARAETSFDLDQMVEQYLQVLM